jgi:hypothetical protein
MLLVSPRPSPPNLVAVKIEVAAIDHGFFPATAPRRSGPITITQKDAHVPSSPEATFPELTTANQVYHLVKMRVACSRSTGYRRTGKLDLPFCGWNARREIAINPEMVTSLNCMAELL